MKNKNNVQKIIRATIICLIVAFTYIALVLAIIFIFFSDSISRAISLIDIVSVNDIVSEEDILKNVKIDLKTRNLSSYPEYGTQYGKLEIPSLGVDLPLYFGDTLDILQYGAGHSSFSYFPGEGGTVLCMAHNTRSKLRKLPEIENGDKIIIETNYGKFTYEVYNTKVVLETQLEEAPIQREKEILMLYTCYPVTSIGHTTQRFFAYANLIDEEMFVNE